jgi:hypothetical protein
LAVVTLAAKPSSALCSTDEGRHEHTTAEQAAC